MSKTKLYHIIRTARAAAFKVIKADIQAALPQGWTVVLAVGWGVRVFDVDGDISDLSTVAVKFLKALELAEDFDDVFGVRNEWIKSLHPKKLKLKKAV